MDTSTETSGGLESLTSLVIFAAGLSICYFLYSLWRSGTERKQRSPGKIPGMFLICWPGILLFADFVRLFLGKERTPSQARTEQVLRQSGCSVKLEELYGAQILFGIGGGVLGGVLFSCILMVRGMGERELSGNLWPLGIAISLLLGLICALDPLLKVRGYAVERRKLLLCQLPFAIDLLSSSMAAGLDFLSAINYLVGNSETNEIKQEFQVLQQDIENGYTRIEALRRMEKRLSIPEFSRFISVLTFGMQSGTPILDILKVQADELRRVKFAIAEKEVERVPQKMLLPIVLIFGSILVLMIGRFVIFLKSLELFADLLKT